MNFSRNAAGVVKDLGSQLPVSKLDSFGNIKRKFNLSWPIDADQVSVSTNLIEELLRLALVQIPVDDQYYTTVYADVSEAIKKGMFNSPKHHFVEFGYFEDRLPFRVVVDDEFYLNTNPDIKMGVRSGAIASAQVHFERHGYKEGRLPAAGWSLLSAHKL